MGLTRSKLWTFNKSNNKKPQLTSNDEVTFDDFQILRAIGKGSFGKVCIIQKRNTKKMYAMKYMSKNLCIQKDAFANVLREIQLLTRLEHPFIVKLWFTFQDEEDIFMVVDLLLGGDLRYHLQQEDCFSEKRVYFYLCEIALALDYLHSKYILHRDIKPDNILLDEEGHVHLTDFNIAIELKDGSEANSMSGTKPYIAPEVFECALDRRTGYSFAADWWSLGVCIYEMISGSRPYDIHSTTSLEKVLDFQRKPWPSLDSATLSAGFSSLLASLLTYQPSKRVASLDELKKCDYCAQTNFDEIFRKSVKPPFIPPRDQLNCDPTFELEEMIIEARPLHKKKKRLSKRQQQSIKKGHLNHQNSSSFSDSGSMMDENSPIKKCLQTIDQQFIIFNREKEMEKQKFLEKEKIWEQELEKVIN
ncbi:serine/threonine-protein kinase 32B-like [Tetranychus urticae]|uniref:Protein kinase domain-containing protein n=1 Tax=Tetranychus urticae TaxID=32264 RepID=T1K612_TETUR|nr:serine/threonine-protein kinase 32B-like [Tetranychus urticae]